MNVRKNQTKKDLVIKMIKELAELQSMVPNKMNNKLDYILIGFLHDTLDFEKGIRYVDNNMRESKELSIKVFWVQVLKIIKQYFDESNKLDKQN